MSQSFFEVLSYLWWEVPASNRIGIPTFLGCRCSGWRSGRAASACRYLPRRCRSQGLMIGGIGTTSQRRNRGESLLPSSFSYPFPLHLQLSKHTEAFCVPESKYPRINMNMGSSIPVNSTVAWDAPFLLPAAADFSKYSAVLLACVLKESDRGLKVGPFDLTAICFPHGPGVQARRFNVLAGSLSSAFQENSLACSLLRAAFKLPRTR